MSTIQQCPHYSSAHTTAVWGYMTNEIPTYFSHSLLEINVLKFEAEILSRPCIEIIGQLVGVR